MTLTMVIDTNGHIIQVLSSTSVTQQKHRITYTKLILCEENETKIINKYIKPS